MPDAHELASSVTFLHLAVDQTRRHLPLTDVPPSTSLLLPCPKMGREGIEVQIEAIAGEKWETARDQDVSQRVDDAMRCVLRAGA